MKFIHTSDWHIGKTLYGRKRYREFEQFLNWLLVLIEEQGIDALLVAGDIFDNSTPSNRALQMYYQFLCRVAKSCCRHVVVIAGNHDSPSLLNAPRDILQFLNVHVVGAVTEFLEDEVLLLRNNAGTPEMIVCAVPYLRDRDIRKAEAGESIEEKGQKLITGIRDHYHAVTFAARKKCDDLSAAVPVVAMGHLFTAGGKTIEGDGVRQLYVGSLAYVDNETFPESIDYLALGHLHVAQKAGGLETRRYSGSPLPMSFAEARQQKSVCLVEMDREVVKVEEVSVPCFQEMETVSGDLETIVNKINAFKTEGRNVWLEIVYDGDAVVGSDLQVQLNEAAAGSGIEILRTKNNRIIERVLDRDRNEETLDDLHVDDVFRRCLDSHKVPDEQSEELMATFKETVAILYEEDDLAE